MISMPSRKSICAAVAVLLAAGGALADRHAADAVLVFAPGGDSVATVDEMALEQLSSNAKSNPASWISLEAYADDQGSRELNLALAQRRIDEVSHRLISLGFPANRIQCTSYGDEHMDGSDLPMRRVEIRIRPPQR
ncbi:MAG: OmpA family protein [Betaproteobacteria bacterium]|nr:OmpA family protein [Betaproteobacteria bacterium]